MNNIIEVENLTKKFGKFTAVNSVTFEVKAGEIFGIIGANGVGKTTAIKMLCGLLIPTSGKANIAGFNVYNQSEKIKRNIGYMSQKFSLYEDLTVKENVSFYGGIYGLSSSEIERKTNELIQLLGIKSEKNKLLSSLPLGWKQKLAFLISIIHTPKIVFLDEPTGGVDPITRRQFWDMIYKSANNGITIIVTTHYMDEAEYCNRVSILANGKISALDKPEELKKKYKCNNMYDVFMKLYKEENL